MKIILLLAVLFISNSVFAADEEKTYQGIQYACTGVGESKDYPQWKTYPVKLMFTAGSRAYVADVAVSIQDSSGATIFQANCDTPWLMLRLQPGNYSVSAKASGASTKQIKIQAPGSGQKEYVFRFPSIPSTDQ